MDVDQKDVQETRTAVGDHQPRYWRQAGQWYVVCRCRWEAGGGDRRAAANEYRYHRLAVSDSAA